RLSVFLALLPGAVACTQVRWYPLYEDVAPESQPSAASQLKGIGPVWGPDWRLNGVDVPSESTITRQRIESPLLRAVMFPINLPLSMICNMLVGFVRPCSRSCCLGAMYDAPTGLLIVGPLDAWHGYPFWEPTLADPSSLDGRFSL